jgi:hypothetical protein
LVETKEAHYLLREFALLRTNRRRIEVTPIRVILRKRPSIEGTILSVRQTEVASIIWVTVGWDNGECGIYLDEELWFV